jgi:hypothetical protein
MPRYTILIFLRTAGYTSGKSLTSLIFRQILTLTPKLFPKFYLKLKGYG